MKDFDLCLNLFAPGRLSKDVSPLKFYEYLATGKPIVSTTEPLQVQDYRDLVYIADSPGPVCCVVWTSTGRGGSRITPPPHGGRESCQLG